MSHANAPTPIRNRLSPGIRIQRSAWSHGCCRNSALRAYQRPVSADAIVCAIPTGSRLSVTINPRPMFIDQKATASGVSFQARSPEERARDEQDKPEREEAVDPEESSFVRRQGTLARHHALGDRRGLAVHLAAEEAEHEERDEQAGPEAQPVAGFGSWRGHGPSPGHAASTRRKSTLFSRWMWSISSASNAPSRR